MSSENATENSTPLSVQMEALTISDGMVSMLKSFKAMASSDEVWKQAVEMATEDLWKPTS